MLKKKIYSSKNDTEWIVEMLEIALHKIDIPFLSESLWEVSRDYHKKILHPYIKSLFQKKTIWKNVVYTNIEPVVIEANQFELPRELAMFLFQKWQTYFEMHPSVKKKHNFKLKSYKIWGYFQTYLVHREKPPTPLFGWVLEND